jgi:signal transduction histidine kinase
MVQALPYRRAGVSPLTSIDAALKAIALEVSERGVRVQVTGTSSDVWAAPGDLERLFRNLIENAVRHSPPEGWSTSCSPTR